MDSNFFFEEAPEDSESRDILDIMDSYRYMNSSYFFDFISDGRWDHGKGWVEKNIDRGQWTTRFVPGSIDRYRRPGSGQSP
ncbi:MULTISPECIES: hypothetical protein [Leptospira]|uniref:Uncharacterized protein n=4 Tax=Leptospira TaxID=171 RepID=A0A2M9ZX81_9LEPT|nr:MULTISPECIES: hypothetical protein [Leptospira]PJZ49942.1 hypothetical protein CH362_06375 [Leptospira saintgironsiae]PJZ76629.1 hypothetical protein CH365_11380 [Leptospira neocaledonica]PKA17009.1 hypothetical protein CH363_06380 [Leptospira haakeii]PKA20067.1 hypothetical protein CH377_09660 [Leptospira haakeii]TGK43666.1 hypothetical protein EHO65_03230 [Leptospira andrefontaineae]